MTGRQRALAASLWLGENAVVSHTTAATLLRLDGCKTTELHMTVPRHERRRSTLVRVHRTLALPREDRVTVDAIPCTSATRTLLDCAAELEGEALEVAFESARRMGLTSPRALANRARALGKRPGAAAVRELLSQQLCGDPAAQYKLEVKTARLLRESDLPRPGRQHAVGRYRIDFAFVPQLVGVECDSFEHHGYRLAWKRDKRRTSWIEAQGWRLLFVSWDDVVLRPDETLARVAGALQR